MKFQISREALLRPLQQVTGVVERRQTLPVLSNVLVSVDGDTIALTGTDLEVEMVARLALPTPSAQAGDVTIPARKLMDIWKSLPEGSDIEISHEGERAVLRSGRSRFQLATLAATEFPTIEHNAADVNFSLPAEKFRRLIDRTAFSMAQQDVRYFLNGMLLEVTAGHIRTVATDGHRLAMCTSEGGVEGVELRHAIIPRKGVLEMARLVAETEGDVDIALGSNHLRVTVAGYTLTTKLVDGKFPDYDRVIPKGGSTELAGDRATLRQAFQRASILSNEKYRGVRLLFSADTLTIQANNPEQEEAEVTVAVDYAGEELEIGFNVSYLMDVLGVMGNDSVRITVSDANSSALIEEPGVTDCLYVVMPMRL